MGPAHETLKNIKDESSRKYPKKYSIFQKLRLHGFEAGVPIIITIAAVGVYFALDTGWGSHMIPSDQIQAEFIDAPIDSETVNPQKSTVVDGE